MANSGWVQIQCVLSDASGITPYYLTATGNTPGSAVTLNTSTLTGPETLWLFTLDNGNTGRIRSLLNNGLVLAVDINNNLTVALEAFPTPPSQTWVLNQMWDGTGYFNGAPGIGIFEISNLQSGYMAPNPWNQLAYNGMPVSAGQDGGQQIDPAYQWCLTPGTLLQSIYNLPNYNNTPAPSFPAFTGDQATVYQSISTLLIKNCNGDIRSQYTNSLSWGSYQTSLLNLTNTYGVSQSDFEAVVSQLNNEFSCLANIIVAAEFVLALTAIIGDKDSNVIDDCLTLVKIAVQGSQVGNDVVQALETVGLALIAALGPEGTVVAGLLQAGVALAEQLANSNPGLTPPEPIAATDLWASFSESYNTIIANMTTMITACQTDWNRMQVFNEMYTQEWPVSLSLKAKLVSTYTTATQNGMKLYALQALMPAQWQVYEMLNPSNDVAPKGATVYTTSTGRICYLADVQSGNTFPSADLINYINAAGINIDDIYEGVNGWYLSQAIYGAPGGLTVNYSHNLRLTVANNTPNQITETVFLTDKNYNPQTQVFSGAIIPGSSVCGPVYKDDNYYCIQLFDDNFGNRAPFATINLHMDLSGLAGGDIQIQPPVFNTANSTELYTIPVYYGWEAKAAPYDGGPHSGAAVFNLCLA